MLILTGSGALDAGSLAANVNVSGGTAGPPFGEPGQAGVKELGQLATPASMIGDLTDTVNGLSGVPSGVKRSLVAKLNAALAALDAGDAATACSNLKAFINATNAQKRKKLTAAQADALITQATAIRTALGCS